MSSPLERIKIYLDLHSNLLDDFGFEGEGKNVKIDFPIILIDGDEYKDFVIAIGEEDIKRFGTVEPRTGANVPDRLIFDFNAWLDDHFYSRKSFVEWFESIPLPTEEEIDSHYHIDKNGMVRYDGNSI